MNRRDFLKTLGAVAASTFALPAAASAAVESGHLLAGSIPVGAVEWHDLIRKDGVDFRKNERAVRIITEFAQALLQRKLDQGYRLVGVGASAWGYDEAQEYSWMRFSYWLVPCSLAA